MDLTTMPQRRELWEHVQRSRKSMMRWRAVTIVLGGLLALGLFANGNVVIGGVLAALLVARLVMIIRIQRMWKERAAMFAQPCALAAPTSRRPTHSPT